MDIEVITASVTSILTVLLVIPSLIKVISTNPGAFAVSTFASSKKPHRYHLRPSR
ncbi:hypothetical protein JCM19233_3347 [Vibrio astriarenae]|nr:hypothetical protein JCM19233_3347 [Vibrio sp. C7]